MSGEKTQQEIGILLVAESPIIRQGADSILSREEGIEITGQAGNADEALSLIGKITSQTVVLQFVPPKGSFKVTYRLRDISPETPVIVMAEFEDDDGLFQAILAGASAYLTKGHTDEQLFSTIRRVSGGDQLIPGKVLNRPRIALRILQRFQELPSETKGIEPLVAPLSSIEEEVLKLLANGNSAETVAYHFNTSQEVIADCITSVLQKINANQCAQNKVVSLIFGQP